MKSNSHLRVHLLYAKVTRCSKCFKVKWLVPKYPCWILTRWSRLWSGRWLSRRYPPLHLPCCLRWLICLYPPVQPLKEVIDLFTMPWYRLNYNDLIVFVNATVLTQHQPRIHDNLPPFTLFFWGEHHLPQSSNSFLEFLSNVNSI